LGRRLIIAIDGPAGAGKSSAARGLARRLGLRFLDSGALYRAVTVLTLRAGFEPADEERVGRLAEEARIELVPEDGSLRVLADGEDITVEIRGPDVTNAVSTVAALPRVRAAMVPQQRAFALPDGGVVAEGRDIGTVVFPEADWKFYLDADPRVRAERRVREQDGDLADVGRVEAEIEDRDRRDKTRAVGPLARAGDAIYVDSTGLSLEQVTDRMERRVRRSTE